MVAPYIKRRRLAAAKAKAPDDTKVAPEPKIKAVPKPQKKSMWSSKKQTSRKSD